MTASGRPKVYIVGAGPGAPDLLTVRAMQLLQQADVVLYDSLVPESLVEAYSSSRGQWINVRTLGPRQTQCADHRQEAINAEMIRHAGLGRIVVRLKGGDPFIFARSTDEMRALRRAGIEYEIVPGVTAAQAAACAAHIPLTSRTSASSVTFATGHPAREKSGPAVNWKLAAEADTLVLYMSVAQLAVNAGRLMEAGRDPTTPVAVISRATLPGERRITGTLADIAEKAKSQGIQSPAIVIIGEVVREHKDL
ncbi:MAG: uroporphyrinogen-III C-methyltransferase [Candidatus Sumerlaeia bacterium]